MIVGELLRNDTQGILQSACVSDIALEALRQFQVNFIVNSDLSPQACLSTITKSLTKS